MRLIFEGFFYNKNGVKHAVKIYDRDLDEPGPAVPSLIIESPGYELTYNSGITDVIIGGIIESECSIYLRNKNNLLDTFLALLKESDDRFLLEILRAEEKGNEPEIYWSGVLLNDFNAIDDAPEGTIQLTALDGIGMLGDEEVSDFPEGYPEEYGEIGFLGFILDGLRIIPTSDFTDYHSDDKFLYVRTDWFFDGMAANNEAMERARTSTNPNGIWIIGKRQITYSGEPVVQTEKMNYKDIIHHILVRFNAVLLQVDGAWHIYQRDMAAGEGTVEFAIYKKEYESGSWKPGGSPTASKSMNIPIHKTEKRFRSRGNFNHLPGLKKVKTVYDGGSLNTDGYSLFGNNFEPNIFYESIFLQAGEGNYLHISLSFRELVESLTGEGDVTIYNPAYAWWGRLNYRVQVELEVEGGTNYELRRNVLNPDELVWYEVEVPTQGLPITVVSAPFGREWIEEANNGWGAPGELVEEAIVNWSILTPDLPADGSIKFRVIRDEYEVIEPAVTWVWIPYGLFMIPQLQQVDRIPDLSKNIFTNYNSNSHFVLYIIEDTNAILWVEYTAENEVERFTLSYDLENGMMCSMFGAVNPGYTIIGGAGETWRKGFGSADNDYFNQLLVNEILAQQSKMLLSFSGRIYDNNPVSKYHAFQAMYFSMKGVTYILMPNRVVFDAQEDMWQGDWFEISRIIDNVRPLPPFIQDVEQVIGKEMPSSKVPLPKPFIPLPYGEAEISRGWAMPYRESLLIYVDINGELRVLYADGRDLALGDIEPRTEIITTAILYNFPAISIEEEGFEISSSEEWDLPTDDEFKDLEMELGMSEAQADSIGARGTDEGAKLSGLADFWADGDLKDSAVFGTSGFNAIGAGRRAENGAFSGVELDCSFWTRTRVGNDVWSRTIVSGTTTVDRNLQPIGNGFSVRLTRAASPTEIAELSNGDIIKNGYIGNDGKSYDCIYYAERIWMSENLAETRYRNSALIPIVENDEAWEDAGENEVAAICYYDNDISLSKIVLDGRKYFNELLEARTVPEALDELSIGGLRVFIEKGKVLKIREHYEYGIDYVFTVDGKVDCEGILRIR